MTSTGRTGALAALLTVLPAGVNAQAGSADLRYVAPMPIAVTIATTDTLTSVMSGMPTGDMTTSGTIRSVNELRFAPTEAGFAVTAILKEIGGSMMTPMGAMPIEATTGKSIEFAIGAAGAQPDEMAEMMPSPGGGSQADAIGDARAISGLIYVPGRVVRMGESWADTTDVTPEIDGLAVQMTIISRGTYERDTVVDGRTLNVLRSDNETKSTMSGVVQGMSMDQVMTVTAAGMVLWDSALHVPVHQDITSETVTDITVLQAGMTMRNTARVHSISTATPQN